MGPRSAAESTVGWRVRVVKQLAREMLSETLALGLGIGLLVIKLWKIPDRT
jgi:hypothetical protein